MESTFKDFKMIMEVVMKYLNYQIYVFGFYLSIYDVIIYTIILSIVIGCIKKVFVGSDDGKD